MKLLLTRAAALLPTALSDAAGLAGAGLLAYGAALVYLPAGLMTGGALLLAGAWLSARHA